MNKIEDGIYLHNVFDIAYLLKGEKVFVMSSGRPFWSGVNMNREQMQLLLDGGMIRRK
ncbi:hypothetical protein AAEW94_000564 [Escherichia coli]|uniref:hypothetical protein n=1 Tax=Escherichia coli TaxID=562 RepID=UPI0015C54915|nr:hypothetical protein [Escherichia coli]EJM2037645.1 hypothetical protein [Escherichia coli]MCA4877646.1 hypothetical protein [Escherichia coli]CAI6187617.1 hypothetical protein DJICPGNB_12900 [Escherichia coli]HBL8049425.1 hypothetical protein [Escherichia coli]HCD1888127.1 hypothetical protein [Escherichia coli]